MRVSQSNAVSSVAASNPVVLDVSAPFNTASLSIVPSSGASLTAKVQVTTDDVFASGYSAASGNWQDHATLTGKTAFAVDAQTYPITAARLSVTAYTSGSAVLRVISGSGAGVA